MKKAKWLCAVWIGCMMLTGCQAEKISEPAKKKSAAAAEKEGPRENQEMEGAEKETATGNSDQTFKNLDPEVQLSAVMAIFFKVTNLYDNAIGNAEYLLKENMSEAEVKEMKSVLQEQAKDNVQNLRNEVNEGYRILKLSKIKNTNEMDTIIAAEDKYLSITDKMIATLDSVTVDNADQKRKEMDALKQAYLKQSAQVGTVAVKAAQNSGMNVQKYNAYYTAYMEKVLQAMQQSQDPEGL